MLRPCLSIFAVLLVAVRIATAADVKTSSPAWPQFRGPDGQGHVAEKIPTSWSEGDIAWKTAIPGKGWSSPIIAEGKIWTTTAVPGKGSEVVMRVLAVAADTGKTLHDIDVFSIPT